MQDPPTQSTNTRRFPRFGLRTLLLAVVIVAVLLQLGQFGWHHLVRYRQGREYETLQSTKSWSGSKESSAIDNSRGVPDDFVILVRRGDDFACFIPRKQYQKGESVEFDWYYRSDGLDRSNAEDPAVQSGHSMAGPYLANSGGVLIQFKDFEIPWSGHGPGWGYVYYPYNIKDRSAPNVLRICATNLKSLEYIDGRDANWIYKAYPGDTGLRGDESALSK